MSATLEELRPALVQTVERLDVASNERQISRLIQYLALLQRWNTHYNLTAVRDPADMLRQHLADCLAVLNPMSRQFGGKPIRALDVGSGAGFPGIVIAIMQPHVSVTCVDSVGKKAAFIQQAAAELHLVNVQSRHGRVEDLSHQTFDLVTSRAFASLVDFTSSSRELLGPCACWMAMKGKLPVDEIAALPSSIDVFHVEQLAVPDLAADRCLVWMRRSQPSA